MWPFYASGRWHSTPVTAASTAVAVASVDFTAGPVDEEVVG